MADVYRIGINIALAGTIQQQLATLSTQLLGLHTTAGQVTNQFNRWAWAIGGVAAVMGGSMLLGGIVKLAEHGKEVAHQLEQMNALGMSFAEIQEANAKALEVTSSVLTTTYSDNLKHMRELRYAFGSTEDAIKYLEVVSKANAILNSVRGKFGGKDEVWELIKSGEILGKTADPQEELKFIDFMTRASVATGGKVAPRQIMSAVQYGRSAALGWSDDFMGLILPRLIQSMPGGGGGGGTGGPGNALMTAFAKIIQGQVSKASATEFDFLGLGTASHIKGSGHSLLGGIVGRELFLENPYEWIQQYAMPALERRGITDRLGILTHISRLMGVRTASQVLSEMALQGRFALGEQSPFEKDKRLTQMAMGVNAYDYLITRDPTTVLAAFHAQMKNLGETLGAPMWAPGGFVIRALSAITVMLNSMARFAGAHPEGVQLALEALAVLGAGLVVGGLIALAGAIGGLIGVTGAIVGAAAALATFAALNWDSIKAGAASLWEFVTSIVSAMPELMKSITIAFPEFVKSITIGIGTVFSDLGKALLDAIRAMINNITGGVLGAPGSPTTAPAITSPPPGGSEPFYDPMSGAPLGGPKKQSYNAVPPPSGSGSDGGDGAVYLDGKKVGDILTGRMVQSMGGPTQGSAYLDGTRPSYTSDMSLSYG